MELPGNCIWLMINNLAHRLGVGQGKKGNRKLRDSPTMLMKTKEEISDILTNATMLMKTNGLFFLSHDMYENKGTCSPPRTTKMGRAARTTPTLLCWVAQMQKLQTRQAACATICGMAILAMTAHGRDARLHPPSGLTPIAPLPKAGLDRSGRASPVMSRLRSEIKT